MPTLPSGWTHEQGAAFLVQGLTAFYALRALGEVKKGQTVLVHSAAGGCGLFGLGICNALGATPIATVGSQTKVTAVLERFPDMDPDTIIVRDRRRFRQQDLPPPPPQIGTRHVRRRDGRGDGGLLRGRVGEFGEGREVRGLRRRGPHPRGRPRVVQRPRIRHNTGWKYLWRPRVDPTNLPGENKSVMGFNLIWMFDKIVELGGLLTDLDALRLPAPKVGESFDFDRLPDAIRTFSIGRDVGQGCGDASGGLG